MQTGLVTLKQPHTVCTWCTIVSRGCHDHTESVGAFVSVLCNLMTMQLLYICGQFIWN